MPNDTTGYSAAFSKLPAGLRHKLLSRLYLLTGAGALLQDLADEVEPPLPDDLYTLIDIVAHSSQAALDLVQGYENPKP